MSNQNAAANVRDARLNDVTELSNSTARAELGASGNKSVSATASLQVSSTEGGKTVKDGVKATVALETSHEETDGSAE